MSEQDANISEACSGRTVERVLYIGSGVIVVFRDACTLSIEWEPTALTSRFQGTSPAPPTTTEREAE